MTVTDTNNMHTLVQHYFKPPSRILGLAGENGRRESCQTEGGIKDKVRSVRGFTGSNRAIACRETLSCHCVWLKVSLLLNSGMGEWLY